MAEAGILVGKAALSTVFGEMMKPVSELVSKTRNFKTTRSKLASTVDEIERMDKDLDEETQSLKEKRQEAQKLVSKYSEVPWWKFFCLPSYHDKLQAMNESLTSVMRARKAKVVEEILSTLKSSHGKQFKGWCSVPEKPDMTVGLDGPLNELKIQLHQSGSPVLVLTGLAGSGKTTLATLLCWDKEIRGKFGENILFVTVSKTPHLKTIVERLFQHCESVVPDLRSDEHAVNQLKSLLKKIGKRPLMLVLDDVWPGSELLIKAFEVQLPYYKVLVTSRVEFPRFDTCYLKPLCDEDAVTLFRHFALRNTGRSYTPEEDLVQQVARGCWGLPLALETIGGNLCGQSTEMWQKMKKELSKGRSVLESNIVLHTRLQKCLDDLLEDKPVIKECFMDLGLFLEHQRIPVAALIDMWTELHNLEDDTDAMIQVHDLTNRQLANLMVTRNVAMDADMYYNNHFVKQHVLHRELAIPQSSQEPFEQRKRLIIDLSGNNLPEWWVGQNQQGSVARILPFLSTRSKQVAARTLSISTDETFTSDWCNMQPDEAEVLVLNLRSSKYNLPEFTKKMSKLKVLIVTNYGFHHSELNKFELLGSLPNMKRIRLEKVSVPCLCKLKNLRKLSLHMCNTRQVFESCSIQISDALPNLVEMNIDYCQDLVELPSGLCNISPLKKLSITNCHKFSELPQDIGMLENLEVLRLSSCIDLPVMPESVERLHKLSCLDISECIRLAQLPENIGDLHSLEKLYMWGCSGLSKLPPSVMNFEHLKHDIYVICDEERAALWKHFPSLPNIKTIEAEVSLRWPPGFRS